MGGSRSASPCAPQLEAQLPTDRTPAHGFRLGGLVGAWHLESGL